MGRPSGGRQRALPAGPEVGRGCWFKEKRKIIKLKKEGPLNFSLLQEGFLKDETQKTEEFLWFESLWLGDLVLSACMGTNFMQRLPRNERRNDCGDEVT